MVENSCSEGEGRVVLVTGGSRGIGEAICMEFAHPGNTVVVNYRSSRSKAEEVVEKVKSCGGKAFSIKADVAVPGEVKGMVEEVAGRCNGIDVLVNNAGLTRSGFLMLVGEEAWEEVMDTNLKGVFNTCKAVIPSMIDRKKGIIINISSLSGIIGLAGEVPYSAAKGGVIALTRALSKEVARFGILVNAVAPGVIESEMTEGLPDADRERFKRDIPLQRFGKPEEVSGVVRFLASPEARYITGETVVVSGGLWELGRSQW
ncbi:MAG: 3-oxoacyl-ACP reductase family protein, partial [Thermodesulfobacteriota bacterium]